MYPWPLYSQLLTLKHCGPRSSPWVRLHRNLVKGWLLSSGKHAEHLAFGAVGQRTALCSALLPQLWRSLSFSYQMILFSACCICGLIGGILNFQFLRAVTKKTSSLYPLHLASMSLACIGIGGCTLSSWLTCRLASYEQRRMFSEREHSLHHSHEMAEKVSFVPLRLASSMWWRLQRNLGQSTGSFRWELEELDFLKLWPHRAKNGNFLLLFSLLFWVHLFSTIS